EGSAETFESFDFWGEATARGHESPARLRAFSPFYEMGWSAKARSTKHEGTKARRASAITVMGVRSNSDPIA
ncbi:MAG TPA: hypothetical protein VGY48_00675, partial [Vicinamibacterales bacterium]|nr:hypothetical protein [Vicinamibacterales bacterium]